MKNLYKLIIIAISANILTVLLYSHLMTLPGESGESWFIGLFCMPAIWIISAVLAIILSYKNRKLYFQKNFWLWTILLIVFCTPIPIGFIYAEFFDSDTYQAESDTIARNDHSLMHEEWVYKSNNKMAVNKYYRTQGNEDTLTYKRDSIWTYFNKSGDTIKIEKYDNGKLISIIKNANKR
jgi:hypothetical protein